MTETTVAAWGLGGSPLQPFEDPGKAGKMGKIGELRSFSIVLPVELQSYGLNGGLGGAAGMLKQHRIFACLSSVGTACLVDHCCPLARSLGGVQAEGALRCKGKPPMRFHMTGTQGYGRDRELENQFSPKNIVRFLESRDPRAKTADV